MCCWIPSPGIVFFPSTYNFILGFLRLEAKTYFSLMSILDMICVKNLGCSSTVIFHVLLSIFSPSASCPLTKTINISGFAFQSSWRDIVYLLLAEQYKLPLSKCEDCKNTCTEQLAKKRRGSWKTDSKYETYLELILQGVCLTEDWARPLK